MREATTRWQAPPRPAGQLCLEAADDLSAAIEILAQWGVRIPRRSRLRTAERDLRRLASKGSLPAHLGRRRRAVSALFVAMDYAAIAAALPDHADAELRKQLTSSVQGPLTTYGGSESELQLQSQHWVGAFLRAAGTTPMIPKATSRPGKRPDFLVPNGVSTYGIEVKRPTSRRRLVPSLDTAAEQLRSYDVRGCLVLDATDLLRRRPPHSFERRVIEISEQLHGQIWSDAEGLQPGYKPGYSTFMVVSVIARGAWQLHIGRRANLEILNYSSSTVFAATEHSLAERRATWLRSVIQDGFQRMGRTIAERARAAPN